MLNRFRVFAVVLAGVFSSTHCFAQEGWGNSPSSLLSVMAEGIGEMPYASAEWVEAAGVAFEAAVKLHADELKHLEPFTMCEVAHNAPAYLHAGATYAWWVEFDGANVEVGVGELTSSECDYKIVGDLINMQRGKTQGQIGIGGEMSPTDIAKSVSGLAPGIKSPEMGGI